MCRVLTYLGKPIILEDLLFNPDNSFIKQSYDPNYMSYLLNLAGFGMVAWDSNSPNKNLPFIYKSDQLPFYDENLRNLTQKINSYCLLTHVRGVSYTNREIVSRQNVHPFLFEGTSLALAHNGDLYDFNKMKIKLLNYIDEGLQNKIIGSTDSEWIYALLLSQLKNLNGSYSFDEIIIAIEKTFKILKEIRYELNIRVTSPVNLFLTNGDFIAATRFVFDFGWPPKETSENQEHLAYHSLWYTFGECYENSNNTYVMKPGPKKCSVIVASEPLTNDTTTWIEVPEYTILIARLKNETIEIKTKDLNLN